MTQWSPSRKNSQKFDLLTVLCDSGRMTVKTTACFVDCAGRGLKSGVLVRLGGRWFRPSVWYVGVVVDAGSTGDI